jgi:hypothetical protein
VAAHDLTCAATSSDLAGPAEVMATDSTYSAGFIALRTGFVGAHVDYVVVYALP